MEGRTLRSVVIDLFQHWVRNETEEEEHDLEGPSPKELEAFPWLKISQKYKKPDISPDMEDIRLSIARGWAAETEDFRSSGSE